MGNCGARARSHRVAGRDFKVAKEKQLHHTKSAEEFAKWVQTATVAEAETRAAVQASLQALHKVGATSLDSDA